MQCTLIYTILYIDTFVYILLYMYLSRDIFYALIHFSGRVIDQLWLYNHLKLLVQDTMNSVCDETITDETKTLSKEYHLFLYVCVI